MKDLKKFSKQKSTRINIQNYTNVFDTIKKESNSNYLKLSKNHSVRNNFIKDVCELIDEYFNKEKNHIVVVNSNSNSNNNQNLADNNNIDNQNAK